MTGDFTRDQPVDTGFLMTPHGLWTLPVSTGARNLLGWLHSHTDEFLGRVTVNYARRVLKSSSVSKWLDELEAVGMLTIERGGSGQRCRITLLSHPWLKLHRPRTVAPSTDRAETGAVGDDVRDDDRADIGAVTEPIPDRIGEHPEDQSSETPVLAVASQQLAPPSRADDASRRAAPAAKTTRAERDAVFQSLVIACGMTFEEMTARQRRACGVAVSELVAVGATPDEIARRAVVYGQRYEATLTPSAMANQWAMCREAPPPPAQRTTNGHMEGALAILAERRLKVAR